MGINTITLWQTAVKKGYTNIISKLKTRSNEISTKVLLIRINSNGAEPQVIRFPSQCHKRFRTEKDAREFIDDWKRTSAQAQIVVDQGVENIGTKDIISGMTISEDK
jgi:hypothetical protein